MSADAAVPTAGQPVQLMATANNIGADAVAGARVADPTRITQPADVRPLRLTLTWAELQEVMAGYQIGAGDAADSKLVEIMVTAPAELLPMRDVTREVWGGIAAPFWAPLHPTQAWRIFLPIPPG
jgi:hypothetical protein